MKERKDVLLKDCFTYEELVTVCACLGCLAAFYSANKYFFWDDSIEKKIVELEDLDRLLMAAAVYLMD